MMSSLSLRGRALSLSFSLSLCFFLFVAGPFKLELNTYLKENVFFLTNIDLESRNNSFSEKIESTFLFKNIS